MQVRSLVRENPLEQEMATRSSILAWEIPWTEEPGGLQSMGLQIWGTTERACTHTHTQRQGGQPDRSVIFQPNAFDSVESKLGLGAVKQQDAEVILTPI